MYYNSDIVHKILKPLKWVDLKGNVNETMGQSTILMHIRDAERSGTLHSMWNRKIGVVFLLMVARTEIEHKLFILLP